MIVGVGIDIAAVQRIARALERFGSRFAQRVLTVNEQKELHDRGGNVAEFVAGRFAAKEAASKALGAPADVWFHDVEVRCGARGEPNLFLLGAAQPHAERLGVQRSFLSISHDGGVAAAVVVLEGEPPR